MYDLEQQNASAKIMQIQIYDNEGKTFDRYTVVYMDEPEDHQGLLACVGMSEHPFHPQGFGMHSSASPGLHLGKRISFRDLPPDCQRIVLRDLDTGKTALYPQDYDLSLAELDTTYNANGSGSHPGYSRSEWQDEVCEGNTSRSYMEWVESQLEQEFDEFHGLLDAGMSDFMGSAEAISNRLFFNGVNGCFMESITMGEHDCSLMLFGGGEDAHFQWQTESGQDVGDAFKQINGLPDAVQILEKAIEKDRENTPKG
jgi:hypothetical protein